MRLSVTITETVAVQPTFAEMLERLWMDKHTGPVVVHFAQGYPRTVEIPAEPTRISLDRAS